MGSLESRLQESPSHWHHSRQLPQSVGWSCRHLSEDRSIPARLGQQPHGQTCSWIRPWCEEVRSRNLFLERCKGEEEMDEIRRFECVTLQTIAGRYIYTRHSDSVVHAASVSTGSGARYCHPAGGMGKSCDMDMASGSALPEPCL